MKKIALLALSVLFTGCTTYSISNPSLLEPLSASTETGFSELVTLPMNVAADPSSHECHSSSSGRITRTTCSNKARLERISDQFKQRGYKAIIGDDQSIPSISIKEEDEGFLLRMGSDIASILSLGLIPKVRHDDIVITYNDPGKGISVTKSFRVSSAKSWFHLFMSDPEGMEGSWFDRAETHLLEDVLDDAKVKAN